MCGHDYDVIIGNHGCHCDKLVQQRTQDEACACVAQDSYPELAFQALVPQTRLNQIRQRRHFSKHKIKYCSLLK